jgi:hypothetical protein
MLLEVGISLLTNRGKQASSANGFKGCLSTLTSLVSSNNKFMGSFFFRKCHMLTLVQDCGFEAQKIVDLRSVATFCGQEMA